MGEAGRGSPSVAPPRSGDAMRSWEDLLKQVAKACPLETSLYDAGRLISWSGDEIVLGYAAGAFELDMARDKDKRARFEQACSTQTGRQVRVKVRELTAAELANKASPEQNALSLRDERRRQQRQRARQLRREAEAHPITQALMRDFGAKVESINIETDES